MSVLTDLETRLAESQDRIAKLIQHLEHQTDLERSLKDAEQGLTSASNGISSLAESTRTLVESLTSTQIAFQEVVAVLQRADPAQVEREVKQISNHVQDVREQLVAQTKEVTDAIATNQSVSTRQLTANMEKAVGAAKKDGVKILGSQLKRIEKLCYALLIGLVVLAILFL